MDKNVKSGKTSSTLKLILRSASIFLSKNPSIVKSSEASQSHTSRRCRSRGATPGLATPPRNFGKNSDSDEPNSPRVSCAGKVQIKGKKKKNKKEKRKKFGGEDNSDKQEWIWEKNKRKMRKTTMEIESTGNGAQGSGVGIETAPCLNQMKRFASGRGSSLSNFEWD